MKNKNIISLDKVKELVGKLKTHVEVKKLILAVFGYYSEYKQTTNIDLDNLSMVIELCKNELPIETVMIENIMDSFIELCKKEINKVEVKKEQILWN